MFALQRVSSSRQHQGPPLTLLCAGVYAFILGNVAAAWLELRPMVLCGPDGILKQGQLCLQYLAGLLARSGTSLVGTCSWRLATCTCTPNNNVIPRTPK